MGVRHRFLEVIVVTVFDLSWSDAFLKPITQTYEDLNMISSATVLPEWKLGGAAACGRDRKIAKTYVGLKIATPYLFCALMRRIRTRLVFLGSFELPTVETQVQSCPYRLLLQRRT